MLELVGRHKFYKRNQLLSGTISWYVTELRIEKECNFGASTESAPAVAATSPSTSTTVVRSSLTSTTLTLEVMLRDRRVLGFGT